MDIRAGSKIYKGVEVPSNMTIEYTKRGREFYLSARFIDEESGAEKVAIRFIDNGEIRIDDWFKINRFIKI